MHGDVETCTDLSAEQAAMKKFLVEYELPYVHLVRVGIQAKNEESAIWIEALLPLQLPDLVQRSQLNKSALCVVPGIDDLGGRLVVSNILPHFRIGELGLLHPGQRPPPQA